MSQFAEQWRLTAAVRRFRCAPPFILVTYTIALLYLLAHVILSPTIRVRRSRRLRRILSHCLPAPDA